MSLKSWTWSFEPFSTSVVALAPTATSTGQADNPNFACGLDAECSSTDQGDGKRLPGILFSTHEG